MADDIASLGISVDTSGISRGVGELRNLDAQAQKTSSTIGNLNTAFQNLANTQMNAGRATSNAASAIMATQAAQARAVQTAQQLNTQMGTVNLTSNRMIAGMGAATNASNLMVTGMTAAGRAALNLGAQTGQMASQTQLARHEMVNLSRQAQDIFVSLQAGQSPFTVLAQQGTQVFDIFASSQGTVRGFFGQIAAGAAAVIGPITLAVGAIAAIGTAAIVAAVSWGSGQQQIRQSLTGIGAASGATVESINKIAEASATTFGASTSEAREFASALAAVGKIGVEQIGQLTKISKDLSLAFGESMEDNAKRVAKAFSGDLSQAADMFNARLGSLNAAQLANIRIMQQAGDEARAQAILIEGLTRGVSDQQAILTTSAKFWGTLGNAISNAFSKFGEFAARTTGIGFVESTNEEIVRLEAELENLRQSQQNAFKNFLGGAQIASEINRIQERLLELNDVLVQTGARAVQTKSNLDSIKARDLVTQQFPDIIKKESLQAAVTGLTEIKRLIDEGKLSFDQLKITAEQFAAALQKAQSNVTEFKTPLEQLHQAADLQLKAAEALTPLQKAQIVFEQEKNHLIGQNIDAVDAISLAEKKRAAFLKDFNVQEGEAAKARKLSNTQQQEAAELEITLINKTAGEQARLRQQMQNRHQLEQAALAKSIDLNEEELDTLNKQSASLETLVNQRERLQQLNQAVTTFVDSLANGFARGDSASKALQTSLQGLGRQLISIGSQDIGKTIANSLSSLVGAIPGLGGITSIAAGIGVSLISRLFGDSDQAAQDAKRQQEELQKAKDAFAGMTKQIEDFNRAAAGLVKGELRTAIDELEAQRQPLAAAALKAENFAGFAAIQETFRKGVARLVDEFQRSLPALHEMLVSEGGLSGARAQAIANVENFRIQILGLKDSISQASLAMSSSDILAEWDRFANEAQNAALAMIGQTKAQSELITELHRAQNTAAALQGILVELGMSAEDAAAAINDKLTEAIKKLQGEFMDSLIRAVNELAGGQWINQAEDLVKSVAQLRADALALGITTDLIDTFYVLSAQKIVDQNKLTGDSFLALERMLGLADTSLHEFVDAVEAAGGAIKRTAAEIASTIQGYQDELFILMQDQNTLTGALAVFDLKAQRDREAEAKLGGEAMVALEALQAQQRLNLIKEFTDKAIEEQRRLIESQISDIENQIAEQQRIADDARRTLERLGEEIQRLMDAAVKAVEDATRTIQNFIAGFLGGSQSFLSPEQQMNQAIATFNQQRALAASGNQPALQGITGVAQAALDAIKRYFGSTTAGASLQQQILDSLGSLPAALSPEMFIEKAIRDQTLQQTAEAQAQLNAANSQIAQLNQQLSVLNSQLTALNTQTNPILTTATNTGTTTTNTGATKTSVDATKTALDVANSTLNSINNAVINLVQINSRLIEANDHLFALRRMIAQENLLWPYNPPNIIQLPTFEKGGFVEGPSHSRGGVLANLEGGEMIMNRRATRMNRGTLERMNAGNDNSNDIKATLREGFERLLRMTALTHEDAMEIWSQMARDSRSVAKARSRREG